MAKLWTQEEDEYLDKYKFKGSKQLAKELNRSIDAVNYRASRLRISLASTSYRYTKEEDDILIKNYGRMKTKDIAELLGRKATSVYNRVIVLKKAGLLK